MKVGSDDDTAIQDADNGMNHNYYVPEYVPESRTWTWLLE